MKYQVIYFSRKGSTKKVADAIASELGIESENVKNVKIKKDTILFLGSGSYGNKPGRDMIKFIYDNDFKNRSIGLFGTSGGGEGKEVESMEEMLKGKKAFVIGKYYCKGKFWFGNKNKPDEKDLENAKNFANKIKKG